MGDILLPGISNNNIDVKGIIDKLVKVETKKLDRLENSKNTLNKEKSSWSNLGNKLGELQEVAHRLYGYRAPFDDKVAYSSRDDILTATAGRVAEPLTATIRVEQVAQNERILSDSVDSEMILDSATLRFSVGDEEIEVVFTGGRVDDFVAAINQQAGDHVNAKVTKNTQNTAVIILETRDTGENNRISVQDESTLALMKEIGFFTDQTSPTIDVAISADKLTPVQEGMLFSIEDDVLTLEPQNSVELILDPLPVRDSILVKVKMRAQSISEQEMALRPDTWPQLKDIGGVTVRDVEVVGGQSVSKVTEPEKPVEVPVVVVEDKVLGIRNDSGETDTYTAEGLGPEFREYSFKLTDIMDEGDIASRILFQNRNTERRVEYRDLAVVDTSTREGARPKHLVQEGKDAIIFIDGVKVQRDSNQIDDAIRGINLDVKNASPDDVSLNIDRDYEKITGDIIDLIGKYNQLLQFVNDQSRVGSSGELDEANDVGQLSGDITVMRLKSKLQNIMMNPYPTDRGKEVNLLAQIGISMGAANSNWDDIRGGYLQVDEDTFVQAMQKYPTAIKQLFGSDMNNDMVPDNGVAYILDTTLKGYTDPRNGIVAYHIKNTNSRIKDQEKEIEDWNEHIDDYRKKLEIDFTRMQQSLNELEQNQKRLDNMSNQFKNK
jgi:flagellar hook-associated protein 2